MAVFYDYMAFDVDEPGAIDETCLDFSKVLMLPLSTLSFRTWGTYGRDEWTGLGVLKLPGLPGLDDDLMSSNDCIYTVHRGLILKPLLLNNFFKSLENKIP